MFLCINICPGGGGGGGGGGYSLPTRQIFTSPLGNLTNVIAFTKMFDCNYCINSTKCSLLI